MKRLSKGPQSQRSFIPDPKHEHRVTVFGEPRGPWRDSFAEAKWDAIQQELAGWDSAAREHFLAVPIAIEKRRRTDLVAQ